MWKEHYQKDIGIDWTKVCPGCIAEAKEEDNTFLIFSNIPVDFSAGPEYNQSQEDTKMNKFYAVYKNEDDQYEVWGGPYVDENFAMLKAEEAILSTYGSRSPEYKKRIPRLFNITEKRAKEVGAVR